MAGELSGGPATVMDSGGGGPVPPRRFLMRRFYLDRQTDVSGTSGTGAVVEGVQFSDGSCVVHWLTTLSSVSLYKSIEDVVAIHGHDGATNLHWVDDQAWRANAPEAGGRCHRCGAQTTSWHSADGGKFCCPRHATALAPGCRAA